MRRELAFLGPGKNLPVQCLLPFNVVVFEMPRGWIFRGMALNTADTPLPFYENTC
jgi:hypothetical protein